METGKTFTLYFPPAQWNNAPELNPWFLSYVNPVVAMNRKLKDVATDLEGRVAGVDVIQPNGDPAFSGQITIRGISSLNQPNPIYIVNGNRMSAEDATKINPSSIKI